MIDDRGRGVLTDHTEEEIVDNCKSEIVTVGPSGRAAAPPPHCIIYLGVIKYNLINKTQLGWS